MTFFNLFCLPCCAKSTAEAPSWKVNISTRHCALRVELNSLSDELEGHPPTQRCGRVNTHQCVVEGGLPLNTGPTEGSNYLSYDWKCWKCLWWLAKITAWGKGFFFSLGEIYTHMWSWSCLYTRRPHIPRWFLEIFSFGHWICSRPNSNRPEDRKLSCSSAKHNSSIFFLMFLSCQHDLVYKAEAIPKHSLD